MNSSNIWIDGEEVFVIPEPVEELGERATRVVSQPALLEKMVEEESRYPSFSFETQDPSPSLVDFTRSSAFALLGVLSAMSRRGRSS